MIRTTEQGGNAGPGTMRGLNEAAGNDDDELGSGWYRVPTSYNGPGGRRDDEWFSVPPEFLQDGVTPNQARQRWEKQKMLDAGWQFPDDELNLDGSRPDLPMPLVHPDNKKIREEEASILAREAYIAQGGFDLSSLGNEASQPSKPTFDFSSLGEKPVPTVGQLLGWDEAIARNPILADPDKGNPTAPETAVAETIIPPQRRRRSLGRRVLGRVMRAVRPRR